MKAASRIRRDPFCSSALPDKAVIRLPFDISFTFTSLPSDIRNRCRSGDSCNRTRMSSNSVRSFNETRVEPLCGPNSMVIGIRSWRRSYTFVMEIKLAKTRTYCGCSAVTKPISLKQTSRALLRSHFSPLTFLCSLIAPRKRLGNKPDAH